MKAAAFAYARATSVDEALGLLATHGERAKILSGGQSLMPAMNLRLISPEMVIDIGGIAELRGVTLEGDILRIGALTRHVDLQHSSEITKYAPLLADAVAHVAHPAIRNRGTIGGSLAHADPAAELPACMLALDATIVVRSKDGERRFAAIDFFRGIFQTALSAEDLLVAIELPLRRGAASHYFLEFSRRHGDYAIAGLAAQAVVESDTIKEIRVAFFAVGDRPVLAGSAARLLNATVTSTLLSSICASAGEELDPQDDQQASATMRRHLARVLFRRCIATLLDRPELDGVST